MGGGDIDGLEEVRRELEVISRSVEELMALGNLPRMRVSGMRLAIRFLNCTKRAQPI